MQFSATVTQLLSDYLSLLPRSLSSRCLHRPVHHSHYLHCPQDCHILHYRERPTIKEHHSHYLSCPQDCHIQHYRERPTIKEHHSHYLPCPQDCHVLHYSERPTIKEHRSHYLSCPLDCHILHYRERPTIKEKPIHHLTYLCCGKLPFSNDHFVRKLSLIRYGSCPRGRGRGIRSVSLLRKLGHSIYCLPQKYREYQAYPKI